MTTNDRTVIPTPTPTPAPTPTARVVPFAVSANRLAPRERDFGIGYGKSSGYATARRYTSEWAGPRFRVA
ncbi:hypothetical protein [Lysobacter xanthus]